MGVIQYFLMQKLNPWKDLKNIVFFLKDTDKRLDGKFRKRVSKIVGDSYRQPNENLLEGHLTADHVHMCLTKHLPNKVFPV